MVTHCVGLANYIVELIKNPPDYVTRLPKIDFVLYEWQSFPNVYKDHFAAVFTGYITPEHTGDYKFDTVVDDLVTVTLGGSTCINKVCL